MRVIVLFSTGPRVVEIDAKQPPPSLVLDELAPAPHAGPPRQLAPAELRPVLFVRDHRVRSNFAWYAPR